MVFNIEPPKRRNKINRPWVTKTEKPMSRLVPENKHFNHKISRCFHFILFLKFCTEAFPIQTFESRKQQ